MTVKTGFSEAITVGSRCFFLTRNITATYVRGLETKLQSSVGENLILLITIKA